MAMSSLALRTLSLPVPAVSSVEVEEFTDSRELLAFWKSMATTSSGSSEELKVRIPLA